MEARKEGICLPDGYVMESRFAGIRSGVERKGTKPGISLLADSLEGWLGDSGRPSAAPAHPLEMVKLANWPDLWTEQTTKIYFWSRKKFRGETRWITICGTGRR